MKIKELIKKLIDLDTEKDIVFSTDEEGNHIYKEAYIDRYNKDHYRLYVIKGTEEENM